MLSVRGSRAGGGRSRLISICLSVSLASVDAQIPSAALDARDIFVAVGTPASCYRPAVSEPNSQ